MNFDIRTLSVLVAVSSLVFAFASITVSLMVPAERHLKHWAKGATLIAASTLLVGMRGLVPDLLSAAIANTLLALGFSYIYLGTRGLVRRPPPGGWLWLFPLATLLALTWFTLVSPYLPARIVIVSLFAAPLLLLMSFEFGRFDRLLGPTPLRVANRATALILFVGGVLFTGRIVPALDETASHNYLSSSNAWLVAPYLWAILFNVWLAITVTLTVSARLQSDLVVARDLAESNSVAKSQFLANMSHEIRTPMNGILGMLKLLQGTELTSMQMDYVRKTEGATRSLLSLINDILDFSKIEAGKMTLDARAFSPDRLLADLSVILSANLKSKSVEVLFDIDPALPSALRGDDLRLQQVLINLGSNAIKFTTAGEVVLQVRVLDRTERDVLLAFSVRDSGIGIAAENQKRIFDGFSQAEASTTRRFGGTGLGLAISRRIVNLLGGELRVESTLGHGSIFRFEARFALVDEAEQSVMPQAQDSLPAQGLPGSPGTPIKALMVDDNPPSLALMAAMAKALGWQAETVFSGEQAVLRVEEQARKGAAYHVILLDWEMPGMDGWQTARELRKLPSFDQAPPLIIMATGHASEMFAQRSAREQAMLNGFVIKPIAPAMLRESVTSALAKAGKVAAGRLPAGLQTAVQRQRLQGLKLLVAEDNKINQMVAQGLLTKEGADVTMVENGELAVQAVKTAQPAFDAVLMDIQMPVMDGYEATRAIRRDLGMHDLPVIAMTANAMASDRDACLAVGMNDHVGKPFELDALVATLRQLTGRDPLAGSGPTPS